MEVWIPLEHSSSPLSSLFALTQLDLDPHFPSMGGAGPWRNYSHSLGSGGLTQTHIELRPWLLFTIHHADMISRETFRSCRYRVSQLGHDWWLSVGSRMPRMF